jgi:hypothetical protein
MIKFTDETMREAQYKSDCIDNQYRDGIRNSTRAAAAVFEAAANAQANSELLSPDDVREILNPKVLHEEAQHAWASTRDCVSPTPEPFQVGKRYWDGRGEIVTLSPSEIHPNYPFIGLPSGYLYMADGRAFSFASLVNLLPGAIDDTPAESAGGMTDERPADIALANELWDAWLTGTCTKSSWICAARRARELLQPQNKHNETYECVIADLTRQVREANSRAERAEAAIERARKTIENDLCGSECDAVSVGYRLEARRIANALGLTITPARELAVTWEGGK